MNNIWIDPYKIYIYFYRWIRNVRGP